MISLTVNGKNYDVDVSSDMPLLWVIRDAIGLTGRRRHRPLLQLQPEYRQPR